LKCPHCGYTFEPDEDEEPLSRFEINEVRAMLDNWKPDKMFPNMRRMLKEHGDDKRTGR